MSIIGDKYKGKYKGPSDWTGELIKAQCYGTGDAKGLNLDDLFTMADNNGIDTAEWRRQAGAKNAPGRLRMTIGNQLRAIAKKRHGLKGADGKWHEADQAFIDAAGTEKTEKPDGSPIKAAANDDEKEAKPSKKSKKAA